MASGASVASVGRFIDLSDSQVFEDVRAFLPLEERPPGLVLVLPEDLAADDFRALFLACAEAGGGWVPALVAQDGERLSAVPMAPGYRYALQDLAPPKDPEFPPVVLSLPALSERLRRCRHDINNPLAAGLAEAQLLLMDTTDGEAKRALETIQNQFRRIAQLVKGIGVPRPPADPQEPPS